VAGVLPLPASFTRALAIFKLKIENTLIHLYLFPPLFIFVEIFFQKSETQKKDRRIINLTNPKIEVGYNIYGTEYVNDRCGKYENGPD
jgi:hypothetical protein